MCEVIGLCWGSWRDRRIGPGAPVGLGGKTFSSSRYSGPYQPGLWNLVFLFSNLSLVFLMPFAYFFTESEGFAGSKKRCLAQLATPPSHGYTEELGSARTSSFTRLHRVCTPFGLSRMFSVTGQLLVKPRLLEDLDETLDCVGFEETALSRKLSGNTSCWINLNVEALKQQFLAIQARRIALEMRRRASPWQRNLGYPLAMLLLLALTDPGLGKASFSVFGSFGAAVQVVLILYPCLPIAAAVIIGNCVSLLVLSSALPVFSRTLGITRFDLLGDFGRFNWLGNFYIVFLYNMLFAGLTTMCLVNKFTWAVQAELIRAFGLHKLPLPVSRARNSTKLISASGLLKVQ
ncbi:UNVERIFIED_CONTAM: hypothetical protein FKN15_001748 [Acipenser sinensis]